MTEGYHQIMISRRRMLWISAGAALLIFLLINLISQPLVTSVAPAGMISFQLAGTSERSSEIITAWDHRAKLYAAFSLGLDYLFMLSYAVAISLACFSSGTILRKKNWPFGSQAALFANGVWAAAGLDALENLALGLILLESASSPWSQIARSCALVKFLLVFLGLVYAFYGLVVFLLGKLLSDSPEEKLS